MRVERAVGVELQVDVAGHHRRIGEHRPVLVGFVAGADDQHRLTCEARGEVALAIPADRIPGQAGEHALADIVLQCGAVAIARVLGRWPLLDEIGDREQARRLIDQDRTAIDSRVGPASREPRNGGSQLDQARAIHGIAHRLPHGSEAEH